jgi:DNA repair photolyase
MKIKKDVSSACRTCGLCPGNLCPDLSSELQLNYNYPEKFPETYMGLRFTSDAMDCALPIAMDSHSGCSYNCLYCFSNNLQRAPDRNPKIIQRAIEHGSFYSEFPIKKLERFLARENKDKLSQAMYRLLDRGVPIQLGALGDPFDELERHSGWAKQAIPLFIKYKVPVRVGTKGGLVLQDPSYLRLFEKSPEQFWFAWSIISNSDEIISKIDLKAPVTSDRLKAMRLLSDMGCKNSLRFRPFLPGVSDQYPGEPEAWKRLMERSRESGAVAVSFEYIFLTNHLTDRQKVMQRAMLHAMGNPNFAKEWHGQSKGGETCRRGDRSVKYEMTKNVRDFAHKIGLVFAISDPHFKELNDTGCCCGMPETGDPWFSKWSRRQMTEVIVQAKRAFEDGKELLVNYQDWRPDWAHKIPLTDMINVGNWHNYRRLSKVSFGDHMRKKWNNPKHPRGPYMYFDKVLLPVGTDKLTKDLVYKFVGWDIVTKKAKESFLINPIK